MSFESFLLMRHEIVLTILTMFILLVELLTSDKNKTYIRPLTLILFLALTIIGFLPAPGGTMFGGMYVTSSLHVLVKNILNIGVFLILLQAHKWLDIDENKHKVSEFYIILLSTLIGKIGRAHV